MVSVLDTVKSIVTFCLNKKQKFNIIYNSIKEYLSLLTEEDFKASKNPTKVLAMEKIFEYP